MVDITVDRGSGDLSFYSVSQSGYDAERWNTHNVHLTFREEGVGYSCEGEDWQLLDDLSGALKVWVNGCLAWSDVPEPKEAPHWRSANSRWEGVVNGPLVRLLGLSRRSYDLFRETCRLAMGDSVVEASR